MIKSMTGYGKAEALLDNGKLTIEIRSVNGKTSDINIKSSLLPKDKEMEVRKRIADTLVRGSIDMFINWEPNASEGPKEVNLSLAAEYWKQIQALAGTVGAKRLNKLNPNMLIGILLRMPDVVDLKKTDIITPDNWPLVSKAIDDALEAVLNFRATEGEALYRDVTSRVQIILDLYDRIEEFEPERIAATREKLLKAAEELKVKVNEERFEQEMVFYLEKLDINEERVRLRQHCKYFMETIDGEPYPGKKLGFIIQEMGREINTTGSKANHAGIQQCVVKMKDELEKIREQSMNIL
ncbi:MAG: YicC family protein [Bacteroidales bacterium]|nr:YicC family protein [Bacteroidales bacterium]